MSTDTNLVDAVKNQVKPNDQLVRYYKGFHYGEFGSTKTVTAGRISMGRFLVVATDNGWISLDNHPELKGNYDVIEYEGLSQLRGLAEWSYESNFPYALIHVDTISQIQEEYLDFLLEEVEWSQNFREKSVIKKNKQQVEVPGRADYHVTRNMLRKPVKALMKAPVDVVFSAHLREPTEDEKSKANFQRRPTLTQTVYSLIAREASVMAFFDRDKEINVVCETSRKQVAKSRIKSLDGQTVQVDEFINRIHEWKKNG